jgi:hypothetical protein
VSKQHNASENLKHDAIKKLIASTASDCAIAMRALPAHQDPHQTMRTPHHLAFTTESVVMV